MTDAELGYIEPTASNKYLDAEDTGRTSGGKPVFRERVSDPDVLQALSDLAAELSGGLSVVVASGASSASGVSTSANQDAEIIKLTEIRDNLDTVETKLQSIIDNTDTLEVSITDINLNTDQVEAELTNIFTELGQKLEAGDITGLATSANQATIITRLTEIRDYLDTVETKLQTLIDKDFATSAKQDEQTMLLTAIRDNADTVEAKLQSVIDNTDGLEGFTDGIEGLLTTIRDNADTLETSFSTLNSKDFATSVKQDTIISSLTTLANYVDGLETLLTTLNGKDFATETTLGSVLTELEQKLEPPDIATLATEATLGGRFSGGKNAVTATATLSGSTTIYTPAAGKSIVLYWISCINDPDSSSSPLVKVKLGSNEIYRGYAIAHWEIFTGDIDAPLTVDLDEAGSIAITAHYVEI